MGAPTTATATLLLLLSLAGGALAANPIIKDMEVCKGTDPIHGMCGVADPNVHYFDGKFMIFATHDFNVNNTGFLMTDWQCWSSPDLVSWTLESIITPTPMKWDPNPRECWATDAAWVGGKFYFYVSAGPGTVGVMTADSAKGPWVDPIGKAPMSAALGKSMGATFRDPCVFNEPGTEDYYIIAGVFDYFVTKLGKDMVSLAEKPQHVNFTNHVYGPCGDGKTDDKPFMHKNNGVYYLSWGCFYATGKSVYGPFTMQGAVIDTAKIDPTFQCDGQPGQCGQKAAAELAASDRATLPQKARAEALALYKGGGAGPKPWFLEEDYTDRHGSFWTHGGQWYYASNDRSHSGDAGHEGSFRDTTLCYIHFRANGTMEPCVINAAGVNAHDLASVVQAEEFFMLQEPGQKLELVEVGGFGVGLAAGGSVRYPHLTNLPRGGKATLALRYQSGRGGAVEVRANSTSGGSAQLLLGTCVLRPTAAGFEEAGCQLSIPAAAWAHEIELELTAKSAAGEQFLEDPQEEEEEVLRLDSFRLI